MIQEEGGFAGNDQRHTDFGLKNLSGKIAPNYVGIDNYVRIAESELNIPNFEFIRLLFFNLWWAFSNVVIHVILGVAIALVLNTRGLKFRGLYRALFILPVIIPPSSWPRSGATCSTRTTAPST